MARGKNANFQQKRQRSQFKGQNAGKQSKGLDEILESKYNQVMGFFENISDRITKLYSKNMMMISIGAFTLIFVILNYIEKRITDYTYKYETISEIKFKSVYNGHYNYNSADNYETLEAMSTGGRKLYFIYNIILILVYSPLLALSITQAIAGICGKTLTNLFPVGGAILQILEDIFILLTLAFYPKARFLLDISGKIALVKYFFIFVTIFVVIFGIIDIYQGKNKVNEAKAVTKEDKPKVEEKPKEN